MEHRIVKKQKCMVIAAMLTGVLVSGCGSVPEETTQVVSGSMVELTQQEMITRSSLVAIGSVSEISDAFQIKPVNGGDPSVFTDYTVEVSDILRGELDSDTVSVRIQGGTANGMTTIAEEAPELEKGQTYLLYLYQPGRGGSYNTEGDYYYITGVSQGVFALSSDMPLPAGEYDAEMRLSDISTDTETEWTLRDAEESIQDINEKQPADKDYVYKQAYENWQANLDSGFMTQEEFDRSVKESKIYAKIIK